MPGRGTYLCIHQSKHNLWSSCICGLIKLGTAKVEPPSHLSLISWGMHEPLQARRIRLFTCANLYPHATCMSYDISSLLLPNIVMVIVSTSIANTMCAFAAILAHLPNDTRLLLCRCTQERRDGVKRTICCDLLEAFLPITLDIKPFRKGQLPIGYTSQRHHRCM